MSFEHDSYISPFSWRYGSQRMRRIWSEEHKRFLMRRVWVALASAQHNAGLVTAEELADLERHAESVDIPRALELEKETRHDVMAEIRTFAEQCPVGGGIIHWGATSTDITDNVDVLRLREAAALVQERLKKLLGYLIDGIEGTAEIVVMAYTHMQPAEPTTLGYRFAIYAQDLFQNLDDLQSLTADLRGKGLKGAVGTQASYQEMLQGTKTSILELEAEVMAVLDLPYYQIATQTYSRQQDLRVHYVLASIAASLHKFALDFRLLQSSPFGEWREPFAKHQVGSSAMPFKRNPILTENICSLARIVARLPGVAWDNASQAILERTLDDSANRRLIHAEAFLAVDEMLLKASQVAAGMTYDETVMNRNLAAFGGFAATERVLMALVKSGASRQDAHEWIRQASMKAWEAVRKGYDNPLVNLLQTDAQIKEYLTAEQIHKLMAAEIYVGTAPQRAYEFAREIRRAIAERSIADASGVTG